MGSDETVHVVLTAEDRKAIEACTDPALAELKAKLLAARAGRIEVLVVHATEHYARLGIDAPVDTPVHRREVYEAYRNGSDAQIDNVIGWGED